MAISFFVQGIPKSMAVGKSVAFKRGGPVQHFQKRVNSEWASLIGQMGRQVAPSVPYAGPIALNVDFFVPRPQSVKKGVDEPIKRPDLDNLFHKLTDAFNGVFWKDDAQIVSIKLSKHYSTVPGVKIVVVDISDDRS